MQNKNMIPTRKLVLYGMILLGAISHPPSSSRAQDQSGVAVSDSITKLQETLEGRRQDVVRMTRMLESLDTVDSVYKASYPTWIVVEADLRERIYKAFILRGYSVSRSEDIVVVASPNGREIIEVAIGDARLGRRDTYTNLSDSQQAEILSGGYARKEASPTPVEPRKPAPCLQESGRNSAA